MVAEAPLIALFPGGMVDIEDHQQGATSGDAKLPLVL